MSWNIEKRDGVAIVTMDSNPVNKMNPDFFRDLQQTFDRLDQEFPKIPVILTAQGKVFSAGLDFDYSFALFEKGSHADVQKWFEEFRQVFFRVFESPRLTVAAINGHAFAGGLILALACDFRIALEGPSQFGVNEVPIGIPMPCVYTELIRFRVGDPVATDAILTGRAFGVEEAKQLGFVHQIVPQDQLLSKAIQQAQVISPPAYPAYAQSKKNLLIPVLQRVKDYAIQVDENETTKIIASPESIQAQQRALKMLKAKVR